MVYILATVLLISTLHNSVANFIFVTILMFLHLATALLILALSYCFANSSLQLLLLN